MPRKQRDTAAGIHHINTGATAEEPLFLDDVDRMTWIRGLVRVLDRFAWECLAFCLLTTHWHVLVHVPDASLTRGMQLLNRGYAESFNERHGRRGVLQRSRYWSDRKQTPEAVVAGYRYVVRNPVEAGLVSRAEDWKWSSLRTSAGLADDFPFVDASRVVAALGGDPRALLALAS